MTEKAGVEGGGMLMLDAVRKQIEEQALLPPGERVLVSVSGGPDSTALLHILWRLSGEAGWQLGVFHLDHGLRGEESRQDAVFVERMAGQLNLPFYLRTLPPGALKEQAGGSVQARARRARQEAWLEVARSGGWGAVALGHQLDDQVETVFMRFLRGAGPGGLAGIAPVSNLQGLRLVRPLLEISRRDIEDYCQENGLAYREDPSNKKPVYRRNRLRLELLPHLEQEYNPRLRQALVRTAQILREDEDYLRSRAREALEQARVGRASGRVEVALAPLVDLPPALRRRALQMALFPLLPEPAELTSTHLFELETLVTRPQSGGELHLPGGIRAHRGYRHLTLQASASGARQRSRGAWVLPVPGRLVARDWGLVLEAEYVPSSAVVGFGAGQALLPAHRLSLPLLVRSWRRGDRFRPRGLGGSKKLQDYLVDCRVPREQRTALALVADGRARFLGIPGWRWDESCTPSPGVGGFIRLKWGKLSGYSPRVDESGTDAGETEED